MRENTVKRKLRAGQVSLGTWLSLGNVLAARHMARAGFDWLNVDLEHSATDFATAAHMYAAIADSGKGCVPIARVPCNSHEHFKKVLDAGAMGVIVPMVTSREESQHAVAACLYPPRGNRSVGGSVAAMSFDTSPGEYFSKADDEILIVLQCETIDTVEHAEEIFSVPGIDVVFIGPSDLAASMRGPDGSRPSSQASAAARAKVISACRNLDVAPGIHCANAAEALQRRAEGFRFLAVSSEQGLMMEGAAAALRALNG
jgi:4-hydroxy-2-oxoheptanedioate aldolase